MFGHLNLDFAGDREFGVYRCSLCNTLSKEYGVMARFLTNYDMALCLLITLNCKKEELKIKRNICPLLSINKVLSDEHLPLLKYISAVTVLLVSEKIKDDIYDEDLKVYPKIIKWVEIQKEKASNVLNGFGLSSKIFEETFSTQRILEGKENITIFQLMEPSANIMSEIYRHAVIVNGLLEYENIFKKIGYLIGSIIYLLDSVVDYKDDRMNSKYNPLHKCFSCKEDSPFFIAQDIKVKAFNLLNTYQMGLIDTLKELPSSLYLNEIFTKRLPQKLEKVFQTVDNPDESAKSTLKVKMMRDPIFLLLLSQKFANASDGERGASGCCGSLLSLIIILLAYYIMCKGCCGAQCSRTACCSSAPEEVTVNHGCGGKKTYRRDSCTGEYKDESSKCC